jgi:VWFA-related protein
MPRLAQLFGCGALLAIVSAATMSARGQEVPPQSSSSQKKAIKQRTNASAAQNTIRTQVNEITTPVTVEDKKGDFILDLQQKEFHVFDNGVEQHINRWGLDDHPLALAMVIETSSHVDMMAREIRSNGIVVTETLMAADGEAAVIGAGDTAEVRQAFTSDHDAVEKSIESIRFADDNMHLYDAMLDGALLLEKQPDTSHRVLVVIAEAQDHGSKHKLEDVLRQTQKANITIYTIGLSSTAADLRDDPVKDAEGEEGEPEDVPDAAQYPAAPPGEVAEAGGGGEGCLLCLAVWLVQRVYHIRKSNAMGAAVAFTGGAYFHPFKDRNIQKALGDIANELHSEYVLSYQLQGQAQPGVHQIEARVDRPHLKVRARLGYYLAPPIN